MKKISKTLNIKNFTLSIETEKQHQQKKNNKTKIK